MSPPANFVSEPFFRGGPYIGLFGGFSAGEYESRLGLYGEPTAISTDMSTGGFIGGVQVGYDWQFGNEVVGVVADFAFANSDGSTSLDLCCMTIEAASRLDYVGTLRARAGKIYGRTLVYGHGGFAYGRTEYEIEAFGSDLFEAEESSIGWTAGAGLEFALTDHVSLGTEYAYISLENDGIDDNSGVWTKDDQSFHTVKAMLNFRF